MTKADDLPHGSEPAAPAIEPNPVADAFYARAEPRMARIFVVLDVVSLAAVFALAGYRPALGFLVGCIIAAFNVRSLHRSVVAATGALEGKALAGEPARASSALLAFGLVLRLALVTAVGYGIFRGSVQSFYGYVGGLFMPICAVFAEALFEAWMALRRGL
jgi:hypothetical protein